MRLQGNPIALWFQPKQTAPGTRDTNRSATIGSQCHWRQPGRYRRSAAAAAAARGSIEAPRIPGGPEGQRLGEGHDHQLRHVGFADDDSACRAQPANHLCVGRRGRTVPGAAVCRHLPGDVDIIFDGDRHAQERQPLTGVEALLGGLGLRTRPVELHHPVGAQVAVQTLNSLQVDLEQHRRGECTVSQHPRLCRGTGEGQVSRVHGGSVSRSLGRSPRGPVP
ncbi:Uncharacterised protein [Mycobacterium tuberculosis]|uniref:Uncharacterized protein n=1 Tax=Mycobacterium tuberculosis TaxID=1773 RepID=A0A655EZK5_MYCTX|nr:Uncharacterised protein [Mycobacterium tuberculosis]CFG90764.1 Uncharacterised protein [Mycobacterium tuberculosis]CFR76379.1 Uncharacterised protein [Mycobacterium tuberculosis]CFS15852.1 Uncharacterised protein [Mycobacterium tuberculosis]CKO24051.1 Uncharacterised protein [Mycobacterium tuberculosis]